MCLCVSKRTAHRVLAAALCTVAAGGVFLAVRGGTLLPEPEPEAVAVANYEWGLSFQEENAPPVPNLSAEALRPYDAYYCGDAGQKRLYLTFDAGY